MKKRLAESPLKNARLWLEKLEKNEKQVGVEVLKSQYSSGYHSLLHNSFEAVKELAETYMMSAVHGDETALNKVKNSFKSEKWHKLTSLLWMVAHETYSINSVLDVAFPAWLELEWKIFQPIWLSKIVSEGETYYLLDGNDRWNYTGTGWTKGNVSKIGLPPTKELCDAQYKSFHADAAATAHSVLKKAKIA